ncbi:MAG TPA: S1/P1 nuclease [Gammaproteobacteria bacterium]|nr:S1/P1 nuclease [Gammaproteobacteria bacterium]
MRSLWKNHVDLLRWLMIALLFISLPAFSWDATGHRVIAAIAYSQLTPEVKRRVDHLTAFNDKGYPSLSRFLYLAVEPDKWRQSDGGESASWHYLDTPWRIDATPVITVTTPNLLSSLQENVNILSSDQASAAQKARSLAYVLHLVGDAHQPLHCINRISRQFPQGDRGGNLFPIQDNRVTNLHAFWDEGAIWLVPLSQRYPLSNKNVLRLARQLQKHYPVAVFAEKAQDKTLSDWTAQCYAIAKEKVYQLAPNTKPSAQYRVQAAAIVAEQLTLAGYRLGNLLNSLLVKDSQ